MVHKTHQNIERPKISLPFLSVPVSKVAVNHYKLPMKILLETCLQISQCLIISSLTASETNRDLGSNSSFSIHVSSNISKDTLMDEETDNSNIGKLNTRCIIPSKQNTRGLEISKCLTATVDSFVANEKHSSELPIKIDQIQESCELQPSADSSANNDKYYSCPVKSETGGNLKLNSRKDNNLSPDFTRIDAMKHY
ncbi:hypothetical protein NPIL_630001 [Nephila pilipes]|uniref:Uncharacterized protein n=1 Tax=Nephila pilipes TaxID=299642 RepID=A0A8X6R287_NEPPI|nr:hypothetical protein NPIL_630001 [Nephila pilipes]